MYPGQPNLALHENVKTATLCELITEAKDLFDPNIVKVVIDTSFRALYFSRAPIPYRRNVRSEPNNTKQGYYAHIGLYAFRSEVLDEIVKLPPSGLELSESLEQLRWLEHGITIQTSVTHLTSIGVDTPEDLERIRREGLLPSN